MNSSRKNNNSSSYTPVTFFLLLFSLLLSISSVTAQPSPPPDYPYAKFSPSMAIIIVVLVAALFFMGFFSIYIRRCSNDGGASVRAALSMRRAGRTAAASRGLDAEVLETFPTFAYSTVKGLKIGKGALECAVCLNEFEDEETLRLIPKCDHVFHPECIDAWLENHVTCPVCRSNLVPESGESTQLAGDLELGVAGAGAGADEQNQTTAAEEGNTDVSVTIADDVDQTPQPEVLNRNQSTRPNRPPRSKSVRVVPRMFEKFRSHSTGHSLVQPGENTDRFTLRLPEDVRKQVMSTALLNRSGSTVRLAGEGSARKGYRTGEGSSRGKPYRRMGSLDRVAVRSDRWGFSRAPSFLTRAFSVRSPKVVSDNGGASTSSTTGDKVPLNNAGPKSDEPGSGVTDSGRPPV